MLSVSLHGLDDPGEAHSPPLAASPAIFADHTHAQTVAGFDTSFGSDTLLASPGPVAELADILYIRVDFDDLAGDPVTVADADEALSAVGDFMLDSSWGQFGFDALDITTTYRMPYAADVYAGREDGFLDLMDDAAAAAFQDGYDAEEYWSLAVAFDVIPDWNWSGLAYVGAPGVWLNGAGGDAAVIAHEFGHNLGAWHSGWWQVSDGEPVSPAGELVEYGDAFDVMGTPWTLFPDNQFNTYWKTQFGWMDAQTNVLAPEANGTYRLYAHDFGAGAYDPDRPYAIEIPFDEDRSYWIEYRQSIYDSTEDSGIELRWTPWEDSANNTLLLDMSGTGDDPLDSPLWIGETFTDDAAEFSITPSGAGATAAGNWWVDVELVFGDDTPPWVAELAATDVTEAFGAYHEFAVTYADDAALDAGTIANNHDAVLVTGPNGFEASASYVGIDDDTDGTPRTATYRVDAPDDGWQTAHNGTYTVHIQPEQVADTSGNFVPAGPIGSFDVDVDSVPPQAVLASDDVTQHMATDHTFDAIFEDNAALDASTILDNDASILVTGPEGFEQFASFVAIDASTDGTPRQATYRIEAPDGGWRTEHNGTYTVHVRPGQVADTGGNFALAAPIGSFEVDVDTLPPDASLAADDVTEALAPDHIFHVTYTDNVALDTATILDNPAAVRVTGPEGFEQLASFVALDDATDGTPREAAYRIDAPDGGWRTGHNGAYTVHLEPEQVADTSGNLAPAGPIGGFDVDVDTVPPEAALSSGDVTEAFATGHTFEVTYADNAALNAGSILENDGAIRVTGPGGFESFAAFVGIDDDSDGTPRTATYRIDAPDGGWRAAHNGTYTVHVQPEQIADTSGNPLAAGQIGTFDVSVGVEATIGPDHARFLRYTDAAGTRVTLRLTGGGGRVLLGGADLDLQPHGPGLIVTGGPASLDQITLSATDLRTGLRIVARGGDGRTTVGAITGDTPIGRIIGPRVDLIGDGIVMTGDATARLVRLHEMRDGADLILPGELPNGAVIRLAGATDDSRISVGAGIRLLHARQSLAGSIEAPWIGALRVNEALTAGVTVTGDDGRGISIGTLVAGEIGDIDLAAPGHIRLVRSGGWADGSLSAGSLGTLLVHGDFGASLDLTDPEQRFSLARATIRGDLTDASWTLASDAAAIVILGDVQDWQLDATGGLRILRLGGADDADLHVAGRINSILALGDLARSQLHTEHLRNLTVRGHAQLDVDAAGRIDRAVVLGDLTGQWQAESLGVLHVRRDLRDAGIELTRAPDADRPHHRALHRLQVGRWIDNTALRAAGHIGTVVTGGMRGSMLFAGLGEGVSDLPDAREAFDALASIHLIRVRGVAGAPFDVVNSSAAAWRIGRAQLQHLQTDNAGVPFGLAATQLDHYHRREGRELYRWPNRSDPLPPTDADAVIRLV